jgi:hypothetical protein
MKNLNEIMQKAKELQKKMEEIDIELTSARIEGESSGGAVKAIVSGKLELISLNISKDLINTEDKEMLEDMIVAAIREAQEKARKIAQEKLASLGLTGEFPGLGLMN